MVKILGKFLILTFLISAAIPGIGYLGSVGLDAYHNNDFENTMRKILGNEKVNSSNAKVATLDFACANRSQITGDAKKFIDYHCELSENLSNFQSFCLIFMATISVSLLMFALLGWITKLNRLAHLLVFKMGTYIFMLLVCGIVAANGAIFVLGSYFLPSYFFGYFSPKLTIICGLAALLVVFQICKHSLMLIKGTTLFVPGKRIYPADHPLIWEEIRKTADLLGINPPDNLIVGLEPNFFVTENEIESFDGIVKGRSLFLSLSIMKSLNIEELRAIILHELGHFKGFDTMYSKFYNPTFKRLRNAKILTQTGEGFGSLGALPVFFLVEFFSLCFLTSHFHHNRSREENADDLAVKFTSANHFSAALFKTISVGEFWGLANDSIVSLCKENKSLVSIPEYLKNCFSRFEPLKLQQIIGSESQTHPFDSHPVYSERIQRFGLKIQDVKITVDTANSISLITENIKLEEQLTDIRYRSLLKSGAISFALPIAS